MNSYMIIDLQYGSTGKGLLAGYLAIENEPDVVVTAWGPNAGHTYIDAKGRKFVHRMLANGIVSPKLEYVLIGPGSVVDLDCLMSEIKMSSDLLQDILIVIHPQAVIVSKKHVDIESRNVKIGSTMKGTGAAIIERIERDPENNPTASHKVPESFITEAQRVGVKVVVNESKYIGALRDARMIQIEGAQGFSLSMYHGMYPYTTSRDVTPAQVLADCAIPYHIKPKIYGTLRTFPIRVADRFDAEGNKIGTSGPCYDDQEEINWSDIGLEPELTTVTKLPRRIFTFSKTQTVRAVDQCNPDKVFLNFVNYLSNTGTTRLVEYLENELSVSVGWLGYGPNHCDVRAYS